MRAKTESLLIRPDIYCWAINRSGKTIEQVKKKFGKIEEWISGDSFPTFKQLEDLAKSLYVPFGYLFYSEPPVEKCPLPDFRTPNDSHIEKCSINLLETIYFCERLQSWYSDYARQNHYPAVSFLKSVTIDDSPVDVAQKICKQLKISFDDRKKMSSIEKNLKYIIFKAEEAGILVMNNTQVANNSRRRLDHNEFKGFSLHDDYAPLIFINNTDPEESRLFTIVHELAHLWLGINGISDAEHFSRDKVEQWCNQVATEILVPVELTEAIKKNASLCEIEKLSSQFNIGTLVLLRRLSYSHNVSDSEFKHYYQEKYTSLLPKPTSQRKGVPNYYTLLSARLGKPFVNSVILSTIAGKTLYNQAFEMLGVKNTESFNKLARRMKLLKTDK